MFIAASVATCQGNELHPSFVDQGSRGLFREYKIKMIFAEKALLADWAGAKSPCAISDASRRCKQCPSKFSSRRSGAESAGRVYRDLCLTGDQLCNALINLPSI